MRCAASLCLDVTAYHSADCSETGAFLSLNDRNQRKATNNAAGVSRGVLASSACTFNSLRRAGVEFASEKRHPCAVISRSAASAPVNSFRATHIAVTSDTSHQQQDDENDDDDADPADAAVTVAVTVAAETTAEASQQGRSKGQRSG